MKTAGWIIAIVAVIILAILLFKNCGNEDNYKKISQLEQTIQQQNEKEKESKRYQDSIENILRVTDSARQEAEVKKEIVENELHKSSGRVSELIRQIGNAKVKRDTVENLRVCDSLAIAAGELTLLVSLYEDHLDTIVGYYDKELTLKDSLLNEKDRIYASLRGAFDEVSTNYKKELEKPKPKPKRFAIGPAIGYGIGKDGKGTPFAGIVVTYSILKF